MTSVDPSYTQPASWILQRVAANLDRAGDWLATHARRSTGTISARPVPTFAPARPQRICSRSTTRIAVDLENVDLWRDFQNGPEPG